MFNNKEQNLYKMMMKRFEIFELQNPKTGNFDVIFEIEGKKLYAYSLLLTSISTTFESMLSDRWRKNPNDPIEIKTYTFKDFKEFLTFIYSGECKFTKENIFSLLDMAEYFGVEVSKDACDLYLCNEIKVNSENICEMFELSQKYSLIHVKEAVNSSLKYNFTKLIEDDKFLSFTKSAINEIIEISKNRTKDEKIFKAIFQWAEKQAKTKHSMCANANFDEIVKAELADFLPLFNFEKMGKSFIRNFIAPRSSMIDIPQITDMIVESRNTYTVELTAADGCILKGEIYGPIVDSVFAAIQSLDEEEVYVSKIYMNEMNREDVNYARDYDYYFYWSTNCEHPSFPSILEKADDDDSYYFDRDIKMAGYLVYDEEGDITFKLPYELFYDDYLITEMFTVSKYSYFRFSDKCKIKIYPTL